MAPANLFVSRPRIVSVRRLDPSRVSVGDEAVAELGPGLLELLDLATERGVRLGQGIVPEWSMPFGAAGTAAVYVSNPGGQEHRHSWTLATCSVRSSRPCGPRETLLATSRIEALGRTSVTHAYRVTSRESGDCVAEGTMVIVSLGPGGPKPFEAELYPSTSGSPDPKGSEASPSPPPSERAAGESPDRAASASAAPSRAPRASRWVRWRESRASNRAAARPDVTATIPIGPPLSWIGVPAALERGGRAAVRVSLRNDGPAADAELRMEMPRGHGLDFRWDGETRFRLARGESRTCSGEVRALRPDEVNLGRPWTLECASTVGGVSRSISAEIAVSDPRPGRLYYVLTEDCETFDGGEKTGSYGDRAVLGNRNDFMDPEDYRVQMVEKPRALNRIAERYGARWTHFWTAPQRFAAQWAAARSRTGAWDAVVDALDRSVREGSLEHEYAPHIHFDFEPDSSLPPQPRLLYDPATDGLLPNDYYDAATNPDHRYHGWDGARKGFRYVREEGTLGDPDSKTGSLRKSARYLASRTFGRTPSVTVRTGACDFGAGAEDLGASSRALSANGFLANADAGHYEHVGQHPRGRQLYFCKADDLEAEVSDLAQAALVQLRAPEVQIDGASLETLNSWFDRRAAESRGPGVRAIVALTHAMFMRGAPDPFRDMTGGDFEKLDRHLAYVVTRYPDVRFATASEAVLDFLDYYTPEPIAVCLAPAAVSRSEGRVLFPIRILGEGIPISADRPRRLRVQAPLSLEPGKLLAVRVLERGVPVAEAQRAGAGTFRTDRLPEVEFEAKGFEGYELEAVSSGLDLPSLSAEGSESSPAAEGDEVAAGYEAASEGRASNLVRLEWPELVRESRADLAALKRGDEWEWVFPADLFRLLVNPVSGGEEPIARRTHPYAVYSLGAGIHAALVVSPAGWRPAETILDCTAAVAGRVGFRLVCRLAAAKADELVFESDISEAGALIARVRVVLVPGEPTPGTGKA